MIRLETISKHNSHRILFFEASAALNRGEKIGLVGPNGAGKTTLFRMITGEETPDLGQVSIEKQVSIGYFNQDVGEFAVFIYGYEWSSIASKGDCCMVW